MRLELELPGGEETLLLSPEQVARPLTQTLRQKNVALNTRCGEKNMCAGCVVELVSGSLTSQDGVQLKSEGVPQEIRACQFRPSSELVRLRIPPRALLAYAPQVVGDYRINVPVAHDPIGDAPFGVAVDIGTTTVVAQLVDLASGEIVRRASAFNDQMRFGDDVLTRINLCYTLPSALSELQAAVVEGTLKPLLSELTADPSPLWSAADIPLAIAGNTTMLHLLAGVDPSPMGIAPFTPRFLEHEPLCAKALDLPTWAGEVHLLPCAAAYIGADLVAGAVAANLIYDDGPSLLVDVGTNGEILLKHEGGIIGCATAAGPAFEGSGLACGIRAGEGAIAHLRFSNGAYEVEVEKIGAKSTKATGLCGSAYVDLLAEGRRAGWLSPVGRFDAALDYSDLLSTGDRSRSLRLAYGQGKRPIVVTESDIGKLLQAKAAVAAGILTLLARYELSPADVKTLYLAGGFGMHMNLENAVACGLLPGFDISQIELVGNTSLGGATLALLDKNLLTEMARVRREFEVVELNLEPDFEDTYIDQLRLP